MEKKISIIVPCYNAESFIKECIDSIVNQTIGFENIELFLIDDLSTDSSLEIMLKYKELYPDNVIIESLRENKGQAHARNIGIRLSSAPYLIFVDADDWLESTMCERMLKKVENYHFDVIGCGYIVHCGEQKRNEQNVEKEKRFSIHTVDKRKRFIEQNIFCGIIGRSCFRTEFLRENHIEFKDFEKYEDNYFSGKVAYKVQSYCALPEKLYHYRIIAGSNSHTRNDIRHFIRLDVELELLVWYKQNNLFNVYYDTIQKGFLKNFYLNTIHIVFCQFDDIPIDMIKTMQSVVRGIYPDYINYSLLYNFINDTPVS